MLSTSSFSSRTSPRNQPDNHHFQQQQSPMQSKLHTYQVQIRDKQISQFKEQKRQELLTVQLIQALIQTRPLDNQSTYQWAPQLMKIYGGASYYRLSADRAVDLFKVVEKFPNKLTLQLLQVIVVRSPKEVVDQLFQYDVMKLLHSIINYTHKYTKKQPIVCNESASILKEAVISNDAVQNIATNMQGEGYCQFHEKIEVAKIDLRIIAELCRKSHQIRNFAILNHKSYTYCLKAYERFGEEVREEFAGFLEAVTTHQFARYEQQFQRISRKITDEFYGSTFNAQSHNRKSFFDSEWLVMAFTNLLKMKCAWNNSNIHKRGTHTLLQRITIIIKHYMAAFTARNIRQSQPGKMLTETFNLIMHFFDSFQWKKEEEQAVENLYLNIVIVLDKIQAYPELFQARLRIYFLLCNIFSDPNINIDFVYKLIFLGNSDSGSNLISLMANLMGTEIESRNQYQIAYLLHSFLEHVPLELYQTIEPLIFQSDIVPVVINKLLELLQWGQPDHGWQNYASSMFTDCLLLFFTKVGPFLAGTKHLKQIICSQFAEKISTFISKSFFSCKLAINLQNLLNILRLDSVPLSL